MDSLALYASDSSSDNEETPGAAAEILSPPVPQCDGCLEDSIKVNGNFRPEEIEKKDSFVPLPKLSDSTTTGDHPGTLSSDRKRRRRWDVPQKDNQPRIENFEGPLPPPPLGSDLSLIYWDKNYLSSHSFNNADSVIENTLSEEQQQHLVEKLDHLHSVFSTGNIAGASSETVMDTTIDTSSSSWAHNLKRQQEFHNPHFLNSVISHFGLNVLGSNIPSQVTVEEFEYNLVALEEEARYRHQQQLQFQPPPTASNSKLYPHATAASSTSLAVQSDLERAMRGHF